MKIYKIATRSESHGFALLRPGNMRNLRKIDTLEVWWDDWGSGGSEIGDFVFCYGIVVCKYIVFEELKKAFPELHKIEIKINKTEKELKVKNVNKLKWLPKERVALNAITSFREFDCLPQSTISVNERGMVKFEGIAEFRGDLIIPRVNGKGLYFRKEELSGCNFFTLRSSSHLLCTENVKRFCEENNYENVVFLEVGETV